MALADDPTIRGGRKSRSYRQEYDAETRKYEWVKNDSGSVWDQHEALITADELRRIKALGSRTPIRVSALSDPDGTGQHPPVFRCGHCGKGYTRAPARHCAVLLHARQRDKNQCNAKGISHKNLVKQLCTILPLCAGQLVESIGPALSHEGEISKLTSELQAIESLLQTISNKAMQLERQRLIEEVKRLQSEQEQAKQQSAVELEQYMEMLHPGYWYWVFQDQVKGHQLFLQLVESLTIENGEVVEIKLFDLDPIWVKSLDASRIKVDQIEQWVEPGKSIFGARPAGPEGDYVSAKEMIDQLNKGVPIAQP